MAYMGIDCPMDASGDYYLQTNGEQPFSKGMAGAAYEPKKAKAWGIIDERKRAVQMQCQVECWNFQRSTSM